MRRKRREKKVPTLQQFLIYHLRRMSLRWPQRNFAMREARVSRGQYTCAICNKTYTKKEIQLDHIEPVVDLTGFVDWNTYVARLFCDKSGFAVLCTTCHDSKTELENSARKKVQIEKRKGDI